MAAGYCRFASGPISIAVTSLLVVPILLSTCLAGAAILVRNRSRSWHATDTLLVLIAGTLSLSIAALVAAHRLLDLPYPVGRYQPAPSALFTVGTAALAAWLQRRRADILKAASVLIVALHISRRLVCGRVRRHVPL